METSPEAEGYNGQFLQSMTGGGKNTIYIQYAIDTFPLPPDAPDFQKMPKAACRVCGCACKVLYGPAIIR